jgi:hypothetical protein
LKVKTSRFFKLLLRSSDLQISEKESTVRVWQVAGKVSKMSGISKYLDVDYKRQISVKPLLMYILWQIYSI